MDLILSQVPANTVDAPQLVLSQAVLREYTDDVNVDLFYRFETKGASEVFKYLATVPVGDTIEVPIDIKGLPVIISAVSRVGGTLETSDPLKGEFYTYTPPVRAYLENDIVKSASENLAAGDLINIWDDSSVPSARKADNTGDKPAHAFTAVAVTSGNEVHALFGGVNDLLSGMTAGKVYLSSSGGVTQTKPSTPGELVQVVGLAVSATELMFAPEPAVKLDDFSQNTDAATSGTASTKLYDNTIQAGSLGADGDTYTARYFGISSADANQKLIWVTIGGVSLWNADYSADLGDWSYTVTLIRVDDTTIRVCVEYSDNNGTAVPDYSEETVSDLDVTAIDIELWGRAPTAGSVTAKGGHGQLGTIGPP